MAPAPGSVRLRHRRDRAERLRLLREAAQPDRQQQHHRGDRRGRGARVRHRPPPDDHAPDRRRHQAAHEEARAVCRDLPLARRPLRRERRILEGVSRRSDHRARVHGEDDREPEGQLSWRAVPKGHRGLVEAVARSARGGQAGRRNTDLGFYAAPPSELRRGVGRADAGVRCDGVPRRRSTHRRVADARSRRSKRVELSFLGRGNTAGDLVAYLPDSEDSAHRRPRRLSVPLRDGAVRHGMGGGDAPDRRRWT